LIISVADAAADPSKSQLAALALTANRINRAAERGGDFLLRQELRER
jgi:hypothetical protein